jgi:CelD/BcsL family acetyltransferase involved in cellulose biosynthesis
MIRRYRTIMPMAFHPSGPDANGRCSAQRARWAALALDAAEPNAFYAPDMLTTALSHLDGNGRVQLIEAEANGNLIGLLPVVTHARHGRLPVACVGNWMHDHCFMGAALVRRGAEQAAWRAFLAQLDDAPWAPGFLHLQGIDAAGANAAAIAAICTEQHRDWREVHRYDRAMLHSDLGADSYWDTHVRAKKRKELRRLQKRLGDLGAVAQRLLTEASQLSEWVESFLALEAAGWKGKQGTALACSHADSAFFRAACASAFQAGRLHMLRLDLNGRPIAMLVNFRHGEGAFSFKIAIDEEFGRFSPGVLIEIANLHAVQGDPDIAWMDSCAAPGHPMIDSLWAERRTIVQYRIALRGAGTRRLQRSAAFAIANASEAIARKLRGRA